MPEKNESAAPANALPAGFTLKSVTWGYRELFERTLNGLFEEGMLGEGREEVTGKVFELLKQADQSCFDHVLKEFLGAINPQSRWLLELPGIFTDVVEMGRRFAESRIYYGIGYFQALGEGGFGDTPAKVRHLMGLLGRLREIDEEMAFSLMKGYGELSDRLEPEAIELFVNEGLKIYSRNSEQAAGFLACTRKSAENVILSLTRECRLADVRVHLERLLHALVGREVEVSDLGGLDSDFLLERGTNMVCLFQWLYLPLRIRHFETAAANRDWYRLQAVVAAGMLMEKSFPCLHGAPEYETCSDLVGEDPALLNLFQASEYARVLRRIRARWPGARRLIDFGLREEFSQQPPAGGAEIIFSTLLSPAGPGEPRAMKELRRIVAGSVNCFETASRIDESLRDALAEAYPGLDAGELRTFSFLPDFLYPGGVSEPPPESMAADMRDEADRKQAGDSEESTEEARRQASQLSAAYEDDEENHPDSEPAGLSACYLYDEWSQAENDYYQDYCRVQEVAVDNAEQAKLPAMDADEVRQVRRLFERLRPEEARRERHLEDGDFVNPDLLLEYIVQRSLEPEPRIRFYEKPRLLHRDLAVLILLDASGSTGEAAAGETVIDIEKRAALLLGEGLNALGDRFSVCGFSTSGRENCVYYIYKDFEDGWDEETKRFVGAARPANSTRIGAALRHSGYRLQKQEARQQLILLVTDGKPMDTGYDPHSRYAQHDVRMACEENERLGVHTFGISTEENSLADMEIMFPQRRFVILPDIAHLPRVLPRLYVKMAV